MRCKTETLVETIEEVRNLTLFYLSKLNGKDYFREFEVEGTRLNSAAHVIAHLAWAEEFLILRAITGHGSGLSWTDHFRIGAPRPHVSAYPPFEQIVAGFQEIHLKAMDILTRIQDDEILDLPNKINLKFQKGDSIKVCLLHHIRHEASHAGHLSWLCKLHKVETV